MNFPKACFRKRICSVFIGMIFMRQSSEGLFNLFFCSRSCQFQCLIVVFDKLSTAFLGNFLPPHRELCVKFFPKLNIPLNYCLCCSKGLFMRYFGWFCVVALIYQTKTNTNMTVKEFNDLLITNSDFLQPVAVSLTHDSEEAKDLIQETLYRALANREKYQTGTNIKAWLYTIMRNIFINNYRRNKKFTKVTSDVPQDYFMFQTDKVASNGGLINSGIREIKGAINRLPDIFRLSFELHYLGYKYQEIADALNEPLGTIKSRIHFARKILSSKLVR